MDTNIVIAGFTGVLVLNTGIYTWVTYRLLKQSKNALLADTVFRIAECYLRDLAEKLRVTTEAKEKITGKTDVEGYLKLASASVESFREGYEAAFMKIDKKLGKDLEELGSIWAEQALKTLKNVTKK